MIKQHLQKDQQGAVLILVLGMVMILTIMCISLLSQATGRFVATSTSMSISNATYTAEAGVEQSLLQLNMDNNFSGYPSPQVFVNNKEQGYGTYTTTITQAPGNANAKVITSTGNIYSFAKRDRLLSSRAVQVTVVGTTSEGYSVMTGPGGLVLSGSANIVNSSVYVGGTIKLEGASRIGTLINPLDVNVANKVCPTGNSPGATYPQVCTNTQPIDLAWSTMIYGNVCATGQTSRGPTGLNIQGGIGGQGLIPGCTAPEVEMPAFNKQAQLDRVTTTSASNNNTYVCNSWPFNRTWPDGLRLNGNVSIGSVCAINLQGDIYINGDLNLSGASVITVSNSVGTRRPTIMVDGRITIDGSTVIMSNALGTGVEFVSNASNAACGSNCTSLSGNALKATQSYETIRVGGAVSVPGVVFNARWGRVTINGSGLIGSAVGQSVHLSGAGSITFGTRLSSGVSTWTISSYQIKYPN